MFIELDGVFIFCKDKQIAFYTALCLQTFLDLIHQHRADALCADSFMDCQMIDDSAAAIVPADDRADDLFIQFRDQKQIGVAF